jgi:alcohol dehydrogenase (NADP+)
MKFITSALLFAGVSLAQELSAITPPKGTRLDAIPILGLGTWSIQTSANVTEVIADAIEQGYRHLDCAYIYGNQKAVGLGIKEGLRRTGLARSDLWVTTKLWNTRSVLICGLLQRREDDSDVGDL